MSVKYAAKGAVIKVAATATPTNVVDGVKEISIIGGEREMIDVTNHGSTVTKSTIPHPLRDLRGIELVIFYDPADTQHERMRAAFEAVTREYMTLVLPDTGAAQHAFTGYYTKFSTPSIGQDGGLEVACTFMADAAEVFTA
jgi:hypothetical protein